MQKNNFDFLRFWFALIVVLVHTYELSGYIRPLNYLAYLDSFIAVAGFFIISGFLITRSYSWSKNVTEYLKKRARRLLPAYLFIILICAVGMSSISILKINAYFSESALYKYILCNFTFLNFLQPCLPGVFNNNSMCAINGSLWTIKIEVSFYIILPILYHYINKSKKKFLFLISMYVLAIVYNFMLYKAFQNSTNKSHLYFILTHQLPSLMPYFIAGMTLHFYFDEIMKFRKKLILIALPFFWGEYLFNYEVFRPIALAIIVFYLAYDFKIFNNWGKFGDFSYGIYLFHFPIIQIFVYYGFFKKFNPSAVLLVVLLLVLTAAYLSWNLLEKRFLKRAHIHNN
ncbi:MAG: acyltransferase [Bacteroidota bacterium]|nr:acyltransferase [Bacteroidota bacterium]